MPLLQPSHMLSLQMSASPPCRAPAVCFAQDILTFQARTKCRHNIGDAQQPELKEPGISLIPVNHPQVLTGNQHCPPNNPQRLQTAPYHTTHIVRICKREMNETADPCLEIRRGKQRRGSKRCISRSNAWRPLIGSNSSTLLQTKLGVSWRGSVSTGTILTSKVKSYPREITPQRESAAADANRTSAGEPNTGPSLTPPCVCALCAHSLACPAI